jgi:membrane protease YdiL (CAAX protease family)
MRIVDADTIVDLANEERAALEPFLSENGFLSMFTSVLTLVVGAPLSEELFFRGLILDKLRERQSTASALIITALIFAVVHFYLIQFAPVLAAGIVLGVIFIRTENLLVPIIAHAVSNGLALIAWYLL